MDEFGSEALFNVLDDDPADDKKVKNEVKPPLEKKKITPEILGSFRFIKLAI